MQDDLPHAKPVEVTDEERARKSDRPPEPEEREKHRAPGRILDISNGRWYRLPLPEHQQQRELANRT